MKKYELIETEFIANFFGKKLFRIRALVDIPVYRVKKGDIGGFIEKEGKNLSQKGNAWVFGDAQVYGSARVYGSAQVSDNARVSTMNDSVSVTNLRWSLTSLPKGVQVGCRFHSMREWKEKHIVIGVKNGLSPELAKEYYRLMKAIRRIQRIEAKGAKK